MTETKNAATENGLFAALAQLQAQMPVVGKGNEGEVKGEKDGRQYAYKYKYADLTDISSALYPLMGKLGLAFTAKPTINAAGQFVLAYKLVHGPSGEKDEGEYLLPSPERTKPQQLGSFITYARRYTLCCVTGCAPGGDDDDAQTAQQVAQDSWESATPAPARTSGGQVSRPAAATPPAGTDSEIDEEAQVLADEAHQAHTLAAVTSIYERAVSIQKLRSLIANPATGSKGPFGAYINWRKRQLENEEKALAELTAAGNAAGLDAGGLDGFVQMVTSKSIEDATLADLKTCIAKMSETAKARA